MTAALKVAALVLTGAALVLLGELAALVVLFRREFHVR